jgi:hypothetical protein
MIPFFLRISYIMITGTLLFLLLPFTISRSFSELIKGALLRCVQSKGRGKDPAEERR